MSLFHYEEAFTHLPSRIFSHRGNWVNFVVHLIGRIAKWQKKLVQY